MFKLPKCFGYSDKSSNTLHINTSLQKKLDAIEEIRVDLHEENIEVPGVVVAGAQSSGKSSLLENISGIKLPNGDSITTRVPLIIRM